MSVSPTDAAEPVEELKPSVVEAAEAAAKEGGFRMRARPVLEESSEEQSEKKGSSKKKSGRVVGEGEWEAEIAAAKKNEADAFDVEYLSHLTIGR